MTNTHILVLMSEKSLPSPTFFKQRARELGAKKTSIISPKKVFTAEWVRRKCQYGCDGYGQHLTCPPFSPTPQETRRMLDEYTTALLIHCSSKWTDVKTIVSTLEREAFLSGYYKAFGIGSGPCSLCDKCNLEKGCNHSEEARPSMEACGIDVYQTARTAGYPIEVVPDYHSPQNYYGLLLLE
jgi:predicted metal-binding protein